MNTYTYTHTLREIESETTVLQNYQTIIAIKTGEREKTIPKQINKLITLERTNIEKNSITEHKPINNRRDQFA